MKRRWIPAIAGYGVLLICAAVGTRGAAQDKQLKAPAASSTNAQNSAPDQAADGEKLFRTHCGRCHNPPESLSPREVRAVVRHMRVRATLTTEEEKLIVKFLAP